LSIIVKNSSLIQLAKRRISCFRKYGSNSIYSAEERVPSASEMYNKVSGAWLAQSEEHVTLDLGMVSLSPKSGVEIT